MEDVWKETKFETYYISNFGDLRKMKKFGEWKYINGSYDKDGYKRFCFNNNGKDIFKMSHTLVAEAFIGERPEGLVIDHIDRNKKNNHVSNLRYVTYKDNRINTIRYRDDILETDPNIRSRLVINQIVEEYKDDWKKEIEEKCLATNDIIGIRKRGKRYQATRIIKGKQYYKSFKTLEEAQYYLKNLN